MRVSQLRLAYRISALRPTYRIAAASNGGPISSDQDSGQKPSTLMRAMLTPPPGSRFDGPAAETCRRRPLARHRARTNRSELKPTGISARASPTTISACVNRTNCRNYGATFVARIGVATSGIRARCANRHVAARRRWRPNTGSPACSDVAETACRCLAICPIAATTTPAIRQVFAGRPSAEAQQLSELLPLRYEELKDAATAVVRAQEWLDRHCQHSAAMPPTAQALCGHLSCSRFAAERSSRLLATTIAASLATRNLASPGEIGADRLLSMLIKHGRRRRHGDAFQLASAANQSPVANQVNHAPKTFAEGWEPLKSDGDSATTRDEAVAPASAEAPSSIRTSSIRCSLRRRDTGVVTTRIVWRKPMPSGHNRPLWDLLPQLD